MIQPVSREEYEALLAQPRHRTPTELFDYQVEKLVAANLAIYKHADPFRNRIPSSGLFLLVPPEPHPQELDLTGLMKLVVLNGVKGVSYLNAKYLKNLIEVPTGPMLLVDVEDGRARLNMKPLISREQITAEGRQAYTTWRGIVHGILFPEVLNHHNMDLVASRYRSKLVPSLYRGGERPKLNNNWEDNVNPEWGAPSCGSF